MIRRVMRRLTLFLLLVITLSVAKYACAQAVTTSPLPLTITASSAPTQSAEAAQVTLKSGVQATLILVLFVILAVAIASRKIPAMVALPIMALGIGIIARVPLHGILTDIIEGKSTPSASGAYRIQQPIIWTLFGGMFARFLADARIAERIIKYAAEFGGEDPFFLSLLMSGVTALIFTTIGGLPAIIMVGTVIFPVLLSLGVPPRVCGSLLLLTFPIGQCLNPATISSTSKLFGVEPAKAWTFFGIWAALQTTVLLIFLSVEFLRMKRSMVRPANIAKSVGVVIGTVVLMLAIVQLENLRWLPSSLRESAVVARTSGWIALKWFFGLAIVLGVVKSQYDYLVHKKTGGYWNLLTPILPLLFVVLFGLRDAIIPAFLGAMAYGFFTTPRERGMQKLGRSIMDGVADVAAPVVLMLGIGMLIAAAMHPQTDRILSPVLAGIVPQNPVSYVVIFFLLSPLSLYRGPLNIWGLGAGLIALLNKFISPGATMGAMQSVGMLQDPTTTQNVWICGYLKLDINSLFFKLLFYSLGLCLAGLILSSIMFM